MENNKFLYSYFDIIIKMLRTQLSKNRFKKNRKNTYIEDLEKSNQNDQELYHKISRAFTDAFFKPNEH